MLSRMTESDVIYALWVSHSSKRTSASSSPPPRGTFVIFLEKLQMPHGGAGRFIHKPKTTCIFANWNEWKKKLKQLYQSLASVVHIAVNLESLVFTCEKAIFENQL